MKIRNFLCQLREVNSDFSFEPTARSLQYFTQKDTTFFLFLVKGGGVGIALTE